MREENPSEAVEILGRKTVLLGVIRTFSHYPSTFNTKDEFVFCGILPHLLW